jgi:hypothetical protein
LVFYFVVFSPFVACWLCWRPHRRFFNSDICTGNWITTNWHVSTKQLSAPRRNWRFCKSKLVAEGFKYNQIKTYIFFFFWLVQDFEQQQPDVASARPVRTAESPTRFAPLGEQVALRLPSRLAGPLPSPPRPGRLTAGRQRLPAPLSRPFRPPHQSRVGASWHGIQMHR